MKNISECNVTYGQFRLTDYTHDVVVADEHVAELYHIAGDNVYLLSRGEAAKSFRCVEELCRWFMSRLRVGSRVVAVGGGSTGDAVAFACSVYKRGIVELLHVPTTLLAMIDSGIGGKTAIDLDGIKNAVGSYFFADTLVDLRFLDTLDSEQLLSGRGELLKYRILSDDKVLSGNDSDAILSCARYKQNVCTGDPYCKGERNKLNFGHTIGHAMELALHLPHGIAVANGIVYELLLAERLGLCDRAYVEHWTAEAERLFDIRPLTEQIIDVVRQDKKNKGDIGFVLPRRFELAYVPFEQVKSLLLSQCDGEL